MQRLLLVGLNHTTAPLEIREKLAFGAQRLTDALAAFKSKFPDCQAVLLSTCNRVEIYISRPVHGHPRLPETAAFLAEQGGIPAEDFAHLLYEKTDRDVVAHLFTVVSSLDSMVLGETQILGQVRDAYDAARQADLTGAMINPLFQRAFAVGKQVLAETPLAEGRVSVASVAVDYARQIFDSFADKVVLSIGAGEMAQLVLQNFYALKPGTLAICNRDVSKAEELARKFNGRALPLENLSDQLVAADIVVTSTANPQPLITAKQFAQVMKRRKFKPVFLIDIALPRNIDPAVGSIENVYLYNLDDLQKVVAATHASRHGAVDAAAKIVAAHAEQFALWERTRQLGPAIEQLYGKYHALAEEEIQRTLNKLPNLTPSEQEHLKELARRIVNKLLHDPIQTMRDSNSEHAPPQQYLHALQMLFKLGDVAIDPPRSIDTQSENRQDRDNANAPPDQHRPPDRDNPPGRDVPPA